MNTDELSEEQRVKFVSQCVLAVADALRSKGTFSYRTAVSTEGLNGPAGKTMVELMLPSFSGVIGPERTQLVLSIAGVGSERELYPFYFEGNMSNDQGKARLLDWVVFDLRKACISNSMKHGEGCFVFRLPESVGPNYETIDKSSSAWSIFEEIPAGSKGRVLALVPRYEQSPHIDWSQIEWTDGMIMGHVNGTDALEFTTKKIKGAPQLVHIHMTDLCHVGATEGYGGAARYLAACLDVSREGIILEGNGVVWDTNLQQGYSMKEIVDGLIADAKGSEIVKNAAFRSGTKYVYHMY